MSNAQFEASELTTAGFKAVTATTPSQQAHLKALPQGKISKVPGTVTLILFTLMRPTTPFMWDGRLNTMSSRGIRPPRSARNNTSWKARIRLSVTTPIWKAFRLGVLGKAFLGPINLEII